MTPELILEALALPPQAILNQRVPKTLLTEHGAPTAADKRHIEDGIEELRWTATLKPTTVGIPAYSDDTREAVELAVLTLRTRPQARLSRLIELVHRAVPYHLLLITQPDEGLPHLSAADKRWAQRETGKVVLDADPVQCDLNPLPDPVRQGLLAALALPRQPRLHLHALYHGWIDSLQAAKAGSITGEFAPATDAHHAQDRAAALEACAKLEIQIASISSMVVKEKQLARRVELNTQIQTLRSELKAARQRL